MSQPKMRRVSSQILTHPGLGPMALLKLKLPFGPILRAAKFWMSHQLI